MTSQKTRDLVYLALFLTIILVMSQVPWLGFIPLGITTATIIHIPVIIAAIYFGKKFGLLTGLIFGLASWFTAYIRPTNVFDLFFQNPLVSVVPRIIFAYLTALLYLGLKRFISNKYLRVGLTALLGSLIHSVLVVSTILLVHFNSTKTFIPKEGDPQTMTITFALIGTALLISVVAEAIVSMLITTPVVKALDATNDHYDTEKLNID